MTDKAPRVRRVKLKGKHLQAVHDYVGAIVWYTDFPVVVGPKREELLKLVTSLHPSVLTDEDVQSFLTSEAIRLLREVGSAGSMSDPSNQAKFVQAFVGRLQERIEGLPDKYRVRISLPSFPKLERASLRITDEVRLVVANGPVGRNSDESAKLSALARAITDMHQPLQTFLEFDAIGFIDGADSSAAGRFLATAKQCAFLFSATGAGKFDWSESMALATYDPSPYGGTNARFELPHGVSRCFGRLKANEADWTVYRGKPGAVSSLLGSGRPPEDDAERLEALQSSLYPIGRFLACRDHPEFTSIAAAMEWHQDSTWADNQTFAYLAACIGLEAVMGGDGHMENMSRRLADRYAFLVGRGRRERDELVKQYEAVLNLRGRLVHAKTARLAAKDEALLRQAQSMLLRVIWREMHEMYRTIEREKKSAPA